VFAPKAEFSLDELRPKASSDGNTTGIEIADWDSLPDNILLDSELRNALAASIQQVPEIYRSVVLLRDVEGLNTSETAEVLEISTDTVKTRLHRGRLALRQSMDAYLRSSQGERRT